MNAAEITDKLGLHSLRNRSWYIQATCATSGDGLYEGLDWLSNQLKNAKQDHYHLVKEILHYKIFLVLTKIIQLLSIICSQKFMMLGKKVTYLSIIFYHFSLCYVVKYSCTILVHLNHGGLETTKHHILRWRHTCFKS